MHHNLIALAGGVHSGKSSVLGHLKTMVNQGSPLHVDFLSEIATLFLDVPEALRGQDNVLLRQLRIFRTQRLLEDTITQLRESSGQKSLIVCDRGLSDAAAYLSHDEISRIFTPDEQELIYRSERYRRVLFLDIPSEEQMLGHEVCEGNPVRIENRYEDMRLTAERTLKAWQHYGSSLRVVPQESSTLIKAQKIARYINDLLKEEIFTV